MRKSLDYAYALDIPDGQQRRLATGWLLLAVGSLVLGGVLTILIVLSRTPGVQSIMPWTDFFHTAIVVHVDLTVLVWFLAFAGVFWSLTGTGRYSTLGWAALCIATAGTLILTVSPFIGASDPLMNNYVPVLQDSVFLTGLAVFGAGIGVLVVRSALSLQFPGVLTQGRGVLRFGTFSALVACAASLAALVATYVLLPATLDGRAYYELLFWGGGHLLQFTHTQLMLVAWLWLATAAGVVTGLRPGVVLLLLAAGVAPVLGAPLIYLWYDVDSVEHIAAFTTLMRYGAALAPLVIGGAIVFAMFRMRWTDVRQPEFTALLFSIVLFGVGGVIGYLISGINVTIPAHYHGSIVAVTLAFMGVTYYLLPRLGFEQPYARLATWQPIIYGGGQLLHVLGLAWSGGYGVQRKTAGAAQGLDSIPEIAGMAVMGIGGLISVIGGLLFVVIAIGSFWKGYKGMHRARSLGGCHSGNNDGCTADEF